MKQYNNRRRRSGRKPAKPEEEVKVIPLGGLNEIGKNITVLEYKDEMLIVDCGMTFPSDEMYGIDIVIPDFSYILNSDKKIRGLIVTHGHEDHIGAIPYLLRKKNIPIYGTLLTLGLIDNKLKEHGLAADMTTIKAGDKLSLGSFKVEVLRMTHSVADAVGFAIDTPAGLVFHTGDFKIDYTPLNGEPIDFQRLAEIGRKGVLMLMADSTNAHRSGHTPSEQTVGATLDDIFATNLESRIIVATFASNVDRLQHIVTLAQKYKRKIAVSGRSMIKIVELGSELGYLRIPDGMLVDINKIRNLRDDEIVIITTGSQGEPMSALTRMASNDHKSVQIKKNDTIILSSSPIPGNEKTITNVINRLLQKGAHVIYSDIADIHVSGHPCQEELKLIHSLLKPKYFMPVHGEYKHLDAHAKLAEEIGTPHDNIFILKNGGVLKLTQSKAFIDKEAVPSGQILVDGLGVGDVGNIVLRDRKLLSESGLIIVVAAIEKGTGLLVSGPEIISRGFVYVRESEELINAAKETVEEVLEECQDKGLRDWAAMKNAVRDELRSFIFSTTKRNPIILPIFLEV